MSLEVVGRSNLGSRNKTDFAGWNSSSTDLPLVSNWVLVASSTGKYGGPFETSKEQVALTQKYRSILVAGYFKRDKPEISEAPSSLSQVRHMLGMLTFVDIGSVGFFVNSWKMAKAPISHVSFARGISPYLYSIFCLLRGGKLILQTHGMLTSRQSFPIKVLDSIFTKRILGRSTFVVTLTDRETGELRARFPKINFETRTLGNPPQLYGVDAKRVSNKDEVLFAARLHSRKRVIDFGMAAKVAKNLGLKGKYLVLGPDEGELERLILETKGLQNFEYLGSTNAEGVVRKLAESSVFVLPSANEPWGNVLIASLCLGKPVVLTHSSHLARLVEGAKAGVVVKDGSPEEIARAVDWVLGSSNYQEYSKNARELGSKEFSSSRYKKILHEMYEEALSEHDT